MSKFKLAIYAVTGLLVLGFFFLKDSYYLVLGEPSAAVTSAAIDLGSYAHYSEQNKQTAASRGNTLLFFAATKWCQSCSLLDQEIKTRIKDIPPKLTILKVDFDSDTEMNDRYQVTSQHTLILVDQENNELLRWVGGDFDLMLTKLDGLI